MNALRLAWEWLEKRGWLILALFAIWQGLDMLLTGASVLGDGPPVRALGCAAAAAGVGYIGLWAQESLRLHRARSGSSSLDLAPPSAGMGRIRAPRQVHTP